MDVVVPPPVKPGDAVSVVAPASGVNRDRLETAVTLLCSWGLEPVVHPHVYKVRGYTAGSDEDRAQSLVDAFDDVQTKAVICATGGYGSTRLTSFLPPSKLGSHNVPLKRFFGFSDITAIHSAMRIAVPGYVSFHAPMPASLAFLNSSDESKEALRHALFASSLTDACPPLKGRCLQMGRAKSSGGVVSGRLIGGNLTLLSSVVGTPWDEDYKDCILLLEDVDEPLYKVDRMVTQIFTSKGGMSSVNQLAALVLGDFTSSSDKEMAGTAMEENDVKSWFWLEQLGFLGDLPILSDIPIGHGKNNKVLALGAFAEVDLIACEIRPLL